MEKYELDVLPSIKPITYKSLGKVHLMITDKCNLRCPTCFADASGRYENELSTEEWIDVIKQLNGIDIGELHIEGGEPFLRDDLVDILLNFKNQDRIIIPTNGTVQFKGEYAKLNKIKRIGFSIESFDENRYKKIKSTKLDKVLENMIRFKDYGFYVSISSVLTKINYQDLKDVIDKAVELEIPYAVFSTLEFVGRGKRNAWLKLDKEDYKEVIKSYIECTDRYDGKIVLKLTLPDYASSMLPSRIDNVEISCLKDPCQFIVAANGSVYSCTSLMNSQQELFNVRTAKIRESHKEHIGEYHPCYKNECGKDICSGIALLKK